MSAGREPKRGTADRIMREFWKLYKKTNIEKITVKNITDASGIYRTTFYLHFADVYEVLEDIEKKLLEELVWIGRNAGNPEYARENYVRDVCTYFSDNREYLHVLVREKKDAAFGKAIKEELVRQMCHINGISLYSMDPKYGEVMYRTLEMMAELFLSFTGDSVLTLEESILLGEGYLNRGILRTLYSGNGNNTGCFEKQ